MNPENPKWRADAAERFRRSYYRRQYRRGATPPARPLGSYRRDLRFAEDRALTVFEPYVMTHGDHLRTARWLEALANLHRVYALVEETPK